MTETAFSLDPTLAADTTPVGDLALCRVRLAKDANYPWTILVPRRAGIVELIDLNAADRATLTAEIDAVGRALKALTECEKLNVATLGNVVAQLHIHVVGRRHSDAAWPKPIWGAAPPIPYDAAARDGFVTALRNALGIK